MRTVDHDVIIAKYKKDLGEANMQCIEDLFHRVSSGQSCFFEEIAKILINQERIITQRDKLIELAEEVWIEGQVAKSFNQDLSESAWDRIVEHVGHHNAVLWAKSKFEN